MKPWATGWRAWALVIIGLVSYLVLCNCLMQFWAAHVAEVRWAEIVQRYQELAASGKLEMPPEGITAVSFMPLRHSGGTPRFVRFYDCEPHRRTLRYFVSWRGAPNGKSVWQFQDTVTREWIY